MITPRLPTCSFRIRSLWLALALLGALAACGDDADDGGSEGEAARGGAGGAGQSGSGGGGAAGGSNAAGQGGGGQGGAGAGASGGGDGGAGGGGDMDAGSSGDGGSGGGDAGGTDGGDDGATMPVIVASGRSHSLALSIDEGRTWCLTNHDSTYNEHDTPHLLRNVSFSNGWFVSGSAEALFRSRNGYDWEDVTGGEGAVFENWIAEVRYGNGYWVATGGEGGAMRSIDMLSWDDVSDTLPGSAASRALAFGNGIFVTSRDDGNWWQSTDGIGWTVHSQNDGRVYFDGATFRARDDYDCDGELCIRGESEIWRSDDGGESWDVITGSFEMDRFAFGAAKVADFGPDADISAAVRACLGLE